MTSEPHPLPLNAPELTGRQRGLMAAIRHFFIDSHVAPSVLEVLGGFRKGSPEEIEADLGVLERAGYIRCLSDAAQPIEMLGPWSDPSVSVSGRFAMYQPVLLERDLDTAGDVVLHNGAHLRVGAVGVIIELLPPDGLAVEFCDAGGETIEVALLPEAYVSLQTSQEYVQRRALQAARNNP